MSPVPVGGVLSLISIVALLACIPTIEAAEGNPAFTTISPPSSKSEAPLFPYELVQLTGSVLTELTPEDARLISFADPSVVDKPTANCKVFPGDKDWPDAAIWTKFNRLADGALIKTVPLAAPCYKDWPEFDEELCEEITKNWGDPHLHVSDPTSTQWPLYQGLTCPPPSLLNTATTCSLGGYASYSLNASSVAHIQQAVNFARNSNLRLVIKNTGHDFADKSLGAGALSIWTHHLKDLQFLEKYEYGEYKGSALKLGAGVETEDVYKMAEEKEVTVAGGECRTVGIAGGYVAGGGHSMMSSLVGMAADQVLSMEIVLPDGRFVTASPSENKDIFWALRGGGGGTFGVVTSVVIRTYPKIPVTTMTFTYAMSPTLSPTTFWSSIAAFFSYFPTFVDAGTYSYWNIVPNADNTGFAFTFNPFWGSNLTKPQLEKLVAPYLSDLGELGIKVEPNITEFDSLYKAWLANFPPENVGVWNNHAASRLFPRANFQGENAVNETVDAVRHAIEGGGILIGYNIKAAKNANADQDNAVNPAWRETVTHFILAGIWAPDASLEEIASISKVMTTDWMARWREISPGAGAYMSEADINEPDWQRSFFGSNYPRLYELKQKLDPWGSFYTPQGVGSEDWEVEGQVAWVPTQNGRLCRK